MKYFASLSKVKVGIIVAVIAALGGAGLLQRSMAATGQIYLSPSSASVQNGKNVTLSVRINPSAAAVNGVETTVAYDQSKLQFVSIDASGTAFPAQLQHAGGGGSVQIVRGILGGTVNSDALIAKVTFKALTGSGTAAVTVTGNATDDNGYTDPSGGSTTVTFTTPTTSAPKQSPKPTNPSQPSNSGSNSGSSGGSNSGSTGTTQNTAEGEKPTENAGKVDICNRRIEFTKVVVCISANKRVRVHIKYGSEENQLRISSKATNFGTKHDVNLEEGYLTPGSTYYYQIIAEDEQGNKTVSEVQSLKTKGFQVRLLVRDKHERPVTKQKIKFFSEPMEGTTDENGYVTFKDVAPGKHHVEYVQGEQTHKAELEIEEVQISTNSDGTQSAELQTAAVTLSDLDFVATRQIPIVIPVAIVAGVLLLAGVAFVIIRRRNRLAPILSTPASQPPSAPSDSELIQRVQGTTKPDPGSVVTPRKDNGKTHDSQE